MDKKELRTFIKSKREELALEDILDKSNVIAHRIFEHPKYKNANEIFTYVSFNGEVDTIQIIKRALEEDKRVAVPKVDGDSIDFYYIYSMDQLSPSKFGILEPNTKKKVDTLKGLMITPGVAFDVQGNRCGYGKGYYDKYFQRMGHDSIWKIALAYSFQIMPSIPSNEYDVPMNEIITEDQHIIKASW